MSAFVSCVYVELHKLMYILFNMFVCMIV